MQKILITILITIAASGPAKGEVVLIGTPEVSVEIQEGEVGRVELDAQQRKKKQLVITKVGGEYFWASRENRRLIKVPGGLYNFYLSPEGTGYIKVINMETLKITQDLAKSLDPDSKPFGGFTYVEHLTWQTGSINYFGRY